MLSAAPAKGEGRGGEGGGGSVRWQDKGEGGIRDKKKRTRGEARTWRDRGGGS